MRDTKQQWFKDAKYGLFIHWGLYSILAGEYNGRRTDTIAEWIMHTLDIPVKEYEKLAGLFNPVKFDADALVRRAKNEWGMKYLTFTSKHHDGFAMYHSKCDPFNTVDAAPCGRDIVGELANACAKYDMKFCLYYSQAQDWHHPGGLSYRRRCRDEAAFRRYLDEKCLPQVKEILTGYGEIGMIWFDTPLDMTREESLELFNCVKAIQPNCIVSGRIGSGIGEYLTTCDNEIPAVPYLGDWEIPATLNDTWGFSKFDENWKSPETIIRLMVKINSRGGNYLLNIGPKADGGVPQESMEILDSVGAFLRKNGESIYATRAVDHYVYDIGHATFTGGPHKAYIHLFEPRRHIELNNVLGNIKKAYVLSSGKPIEAAAEINGVQDPCWILHLPEDVVFDPIDTVICVEIDEERVSFSPLE